MQKIPERKIDFTIIREMEVRYKNSPDLEIVDGPVSTCSFINQLIGNLTEVTFIVLFLDLYNKIQGYLTVSKGTVDKTTVHPREVFKGALLTNASGIVVAHNRPSGELCPSIEDYAVSRRLKEAGDIIGIEVLDHIIVSDSRYLSFAESGYIQ
ncbi:MAG: DNA repair protein RadC [bacterium]|nr:DNA repair protein RadC [bacterium]